MAKLSTSTKEYTRNSEKQLPAVVSEVEDDGDDSFYTNSTDMSDDDNPEVFYDARAPTQSNFKDSNNKNFASPRTLSKKASIQELKSKASLADFRQSPVKPHQNKLSALRSMQSLQDLKKPTSKVNAGSTDDAGDLDMLMNKLSIAPAPKPSLSKSSNNKPQGFFQKLANAQVQRKVSPPVVPKTRLTPYNESAWKTNPILNGGNMSPRSANRQGYVPPKFSSPAKPNNMSFNSNSGSFSEPLTPRSSQWSRKIDVAALRKPVPFNINGGSLTQEVPEPTLSKEQMILSGKMPYQQQAKNSTAPVWAISSNNAAAGNSYSYISPGKAENQLKSLLSSLDGQISLSNKELAEFPGVKGLEVDLLPHQIHGLHFLLGRENSELSIKGGMLCDDMGLGKTIQSIALILSKPFDQQAIEQDEEISAVDEDEDEEDDEDEDDSDDGVDEEEYEDYECDESMNKKNIPKKENKRKISPTTLVIAPLALTTQWEAEIRSKAPGLRVMVHHGPKRPKSVSEFKGYDVIVTTFQIVTSESEKKGPLFRQGWWRIIIDEAHSIKNRRAKSSIACRKLDAYSRWCLTGTPIQNSIDELYSLISFLRLAPFDNYRLWSSQIIRPMEKGQGLMAIQKLQGILGVVMLRRTKAVLNQSGIGLPKRLVHTKRLQFSPVERQFYDKLQKRIGSQISVMVDEGGGKMYLQGLLLLLRLRQVCDHMGLVNRTIGEEESDDVLLSSADKSVTENDSGDGDELADLMGGLDLDKDLSNEYLKDMQLNGRDTSGAIQAQPSTKIKYVLDLLKQDMTRKTIVFSQFTSMLDIMEPCLRRAGVRYTRYDGSMRPKNRDMALDALRNDPEIQVLLCSLKCGALGLNLTVASQVVLMDPWWNPMVSEQAIDRVHRIGQKRDVDVHELIMKDSVEERILALQNRKRKLANGVMERKAQGSGPSKKNGKEAFNNKNKLTMAEMMNLFKQGVVEG